MKVTLHAQPHEVRPWLQRGRLRQHTYAEGGGRLTGVPFTDVGAYVWRVLLGMDEEPDISLIDCGFLSTPWIVLLQGPTLEVRLDLEEYTEADRPMSWRVTLAVEGKPDRIRRFLRRLLMVLPAEPWDFADPAAFRRETGMSWKKCRAVWRKLTTETPKGPVLPEILEAAASMETEGTGAALRVRLENKTSATIEDLRVTIDGEGVDPPRSDQAVPRLNSGGNATAIVRVKLREDADQAVLRPRVRYTGKKGTVTLELAPVRFSVAIPEVTAAPLRPTEWATVVGPYAKAEVPLGAANTPAADAFEELIAPLRDLPFERLDPKVDRRGQTYRGSIRMFARDGAGKGYAIELEVVGGAKDHRAKLTLACEQREMLPGFLRLVRRGPLAARIA